jgi:hypothetical protein
MCKKTIWVLAAFTAFIAAVIFLPGLINAGSLEPSAAPAPTMKTLDEIYPAWSRILPADDGEADGCNSSRFKCVMGGNAVLDMETALVWTRSPHPTQETWDNSRISCSRDATGTHLGWRLPNVEELASLGSFY